MSFGNWPYRDKKCVIVTRTETKTDLPNVSLTCETPEQIAEQLENEGCRHIWVMGGGEIHSLFFRAGLIDEMRIFIMPNILGEGIPLFAPPVPDAKWKLLETKRWLGETIELHYEKQR